MYCCTHRIATWPALLLMTSTATMLRCPCKLQLCLKAAVPYILYICQQLLIWNHDTAHMIYTHTSVYNTTSCFRIWFLSPRSESVPELPIRQCILHPPIKDFNEPAAALRPLWWTFALHTIHSRTMQSHIKIPYFLSTLRRVKFTMAKFIVDCSLCR